LESITVRGAVEDDLAKIVDICNGSIPEGLSTTDTAPITVDERREWFRGFDMTARFGFEQVGRTPEIAEVFGNKRGIVINILRISWHG
jgi:L-amino acid N-acyltransferase YncA